MIRAEKAAAVVAALNVVTFLCCIHEMLYSIFINWLVLLDFVCAVILLINQRKVKTKFLLYIFSVFIITVILQFQNSGGAGSTIVLMNFLLQMYLSTQISLGVRFLKITSCAYMFLPVYWLFRGDAGGYNANTIGVIALLGLCYAIVLAETLRSRVSAGTLVLLNILVFYLVERNVSGSRTCLICGAALLVLVYLIPSGIILFRGVYWSIFTVLTVGSVLWTRLYTYLYTERLYINLAFSTKNFFTGRERIWLEMWKALKGRWLTGVGSGYQMASFRGGFHVHNLMFDFLLVYGIIIFSAVLILIGYKFYDMQKKAVGNKSRLSYIGVCTVIILFIHAFAEMTFLDSMFYGPVFTLCLIANSSGKTDEDAAGRNEEA